MSVRRSRDRKISVKHVVIASAALIAVCIFGNVYAAAFMPRAVNNQIRVIDDWKNVKAFGAAGDGMTDDTKAIQAALDAGAHVFFPAGSYIVNQLYIKNTRDVVLSGYDATLIKKAGSVKWTRILDIKDVDTVELLGLTLDGNKQKVSGAPEGGCGSIYATRLTNFIFKDLKVCNSYYGVVNLIDCHYGIFTNCVFEDVDVGILGMAVANSHIDIDNCEFKDGTSEGISFGVYTHMTPAEFLRIGYHNNIRITNCTFSNKNANCIQLRNVKNIYISNNQLERTTAERGTAGIIIDPDGASGLGIVPENIIVFSNRIKGMRYEGVKITGGKNIVIYHNAFSGIRSFNITTNTPCLILNNRFDDIQASVPAVIYINGDFVTVYDKRLKTSAAAIPSIIEMMNRKSHILVLQNDIINNSDNPRDEIAYKQS